MVLSALGGLAGTAAGGLQSASGASGGVAESGNNVINVGGAPKNVAAIVQAVQGGGSSLVGGSNVGQRNGLTNANPSKATFSLPGFDAGITINPLLIAAVGLGVLILPRLIKHR